jgi:hypothetical protein
VEALPTEITLVVHATSQREQYHQTTEAEETV